MERRDNVNPFWRHVRVLPPPRQADKKAKAWTSNTTLPFSPCAPLVSEQCPKFLQPSDGPGSHFRWAAQTKQSRNVSVCNHSWSSPTFTSGGGCGLGDNLPSRNRNNHKDSPNENALQP